MNKVAQNTFALSRGKQSKNWPTRRCAREFVLQGLYQQRLTNNDEAAILAYLADLEGFGKADNKLLLELLHGVLAHQATLQALVQEHIDRPFTELSPIESCILLMGAFELKEHLQTPYRVIINEAIELTKGFGGTDGHKYVNGVLDKLAAKLRTAEIESTKKGKKVGIL